MSAGKDAEMVARCDAIRGHSLFPTADELGDIPKLYATERTPLADKTVVLHYFVASADWWVVEFEPADRLAFGFACLGDPASAEWGYVSLDELAVTKVRPGNGPVDMVVERDLYWTPIRFGELDR
jgi:hypothetical protein